MESFNTIIAAVKATNNGRLLSHAMTGAQISVAEKAVARGLLKKYLMQFPAFPGFRTVTAYSIF